MRSKQSKRKAKNSSSSSIADPKTKPPDPSDLELSVFGPGKGECLLVHLGSGEWMIVDSCLNEHRTKSIALEYLESLRVDVTKQVKLVVVSHWHDDHIRGVGDIIREATAARFACSAAINTPAFFSLIAANETIKLVGHTSGTAEFADVLSVKTLGPDHWVNEGMLLHTTNSTAQVKVHALSPSAQTVTDAIGSFVQTLPSIGNGIQRFPCVTPNDQSIVLLVETEGVHLLLGGDLEKGKNRRRGWQGVIASEVRPKILSSGYKVAHHGADNADTNEIWTRLIDKQPKALLTPYAGGRKPRPSDEDVKRIKGKTSHVYCTVWPVKQRPAGRIVDRTMNEVARNRKTIPKRPGHIRLRVPLTGKASQICIDLFDNAKRI